MCRGLFQLSLINSRKEEAQKRDLGLSSYKLLQFTNRATSGQSSCLTIKGHRALSMVGRQRMHLKRGDNSKTSARQNPAQSPTFLNVATSQRTLIVKTGHVAGQANEGALRSGCAADLQ